MRKQQESLQTRKQIEKNPRALHIRSFKINFATIGCQNKEKIYKVEEKVTILVRSFEDQLNQVTGNDHEPQDHLTQQQDSMPPRDRLWPRRI